MVSSWRGKPLPDDAVAFGEIGLSGEVRQVVASDRRLAEARHVGCKIAFVPRNFSGEAHGLHLVRLRHVGDALDAVAKAW